MAFRRYYNTDLRIKEQSCPEKCDCYLHPWVLKILTGDITENTWGYHRISSRHQYSSNYIKSSYCAYILKIFFVACLLRYPLPVTHLLKCTQKHADVCEHINHPSII